MDGGCPGVADRGSGMALLRAGPEGDGGGITGRA